MSGLLTVKFFSLCWRDWTCVTVYHERYCCWAEIRSLTFLQLRNRKPFCSWTRWMPLHCNRVFLWRRLWLRVPLHGVFRFWTYRSDSANGFGNNPILFQKAWLAMFDRRDLVTTTKIKSLLLSRNTFSKLLYILKALRGWKLNLLVGFASRTSSLAALTSWSEDFCFHPFRALIEHLILLIWISNSGPTSHSNFFVSIRHSTECLNSLYLLLPKCKHEETLSIGNFSHRSRNKSAKGKVSTSGFFNRLNSGWASISAAFSPSTTFASTEL